MFKKKNVEHVIEAHVQADLTIADSIVRSTLFIVRINQLCAALGLGFYFVNGLPSQSTWIIFLLLSLIGACISYVIEVGIANGAGLIREGKKIAGFFLLTVSTISSWFLSDRFFSTLIHLSGQKDASATFITIVLAILLPSMQMLQQLFKKENEQLIQHLSDSTKMIKKMHVQQIQVGAFLARLKSFNDAIQDEELLNDILKQMKDQLKGYIPNLNVVLDDDNELDKNSVDSTLASSELDAEDASSQNDSNGSNDSSHDIIEKAEQLDSFAKENIQANDREFSKSLILFENSGYEKTRQLDEHLQTLDQIKLFALFRNKSYRDNLASEMGVSQVTVKRKVQKLLGNVEA